MGLVQLLTAPGNFKFYAEKSFPNPNAVSTPTSFGQKRIGYGDTNQPYIQIPLPGSTLKFNKLNIPTEGPTFFLNQLGTLPLSVISSIGGQFSTSFDITSESDLRYNSRSWGPDFLTRGNAFGFIRTADDVLRLTKYFTDNRSVNGELFIAKQNLLSRVSPKTEASYGLAYGASTINGGVYVPTSTVAQAGLSLFGGSLLKQGIDPTGLLPGAGAIRKYQDAIDDKQFSPNNTEANRLIKLSKLSYITANEIGALNADSTYDIALPDTGYFLKYGGGPGSFLGIGNTKINYATDKTGKNPSLNFYQFSQIDTLNYLTWDRSQLSLSNNDKNLFNTPTVTEDFRAPLINTATENQRTFLSISPSYKPNEQGTGNIETRINFRGAGDRGNRLNYKDGKREINPKGTGKVVGPTDLINAFPIYQGTSPTDNKLVKDLIDFRIGIYDNDKIGVGTEIPLNWLHFRVLLDDFSDSYGADWKAINYMGRAESFYKYESFKRDISIGFTVAAQSKQELLPIYKKLNYLASSMAPSYSTNGFIRGNLSRITLGNWLWEQPGFISSVDLSLPDESPWEINLPIDGLNPDREVKQVPHMVQVKIKFTPIHRFRPEINKFTPTARTPVFFKEDADNFSADSLEFKDPAFGPQRYIALQDETTGNAYEYNKTQELQSVYRSIEQNNELAFSNSNINEEFDDSDYGVAQTAEIPQQFPNPDVNFTTPSSPANPNLVLGNQGSIFRP
jgi:hypothetical protein